MIYHENDRNLELFQIKEAKESWAWDLFNFKIFVCFEGQQYWTIGKT